MHRFAAAGTVCLLAAGTATGMQPSPDAPSFPLRSDAPNRNVGERRFAATLRQINDHAAVRFVLHGGDFKGGGEPRSDERLQRRLAQFQVARTALVYSPGDYEWTDCHCTSTSRFDPLERLLCGAGLHLAIRVAVGSMLGASSPRRRDRKRALALVSPARRWGGGCRGRTASFVVRRVAASSVDREALGRYRCRHSASTKAWAHTSRQIDWATLGRSA
jgi:hypothetical protein